MRKALILTAFAVAAMTVSACGYTSEERAASGAVIGAAAGQALGRDTESTIGGAIVGGAVGAATTPRY